MPRLGLGSIDLSATTGGGNSVTGIDDFFFESFSAGQMHPIRTTSRTNLVTSSEDFTSGWGADDVTFDVNSTTAPDGTSTADKIIGSTVSSRHNIVDTGLTNSVTASISVHAKAGELRYLQVASANTANQYANFDLLTGTIGTIGSDFANVAMDSLANGWYRITLTSVGRYNNFYLSLVSGLTAVWLESWSMSNNTDGLFLWGAQLEEDGFASAYIPTSGSTVTVSTTLNDTSNVWDFDGTDIMIAEDPEDEGFWEESYPDGASLPELVLNGDYEELGSEIGNLDTITNLNGGIISEVSGISYNATSDGTGNSTRPRLKFSSIQTGKAYKLTITPSNQSGTIKCSVNNDGTYLTQFNDLSSNLEFYFVNGSNFRIFFDGTETFNVDFTISLKQVDPNDRWTLGTGWSIEDGKAVFSGTDFANLQLSSNILTIGDTYELTLTAGVTNGSFKVQHSSDLITESSSGTYSVIFTATATLFTIARASVGSQNDFTIDNLTVREYAIQPLDI